MSDSDSHSEPFEVRGVEMRPAEPNGMNTGKVIDTLAELGDDRDEEEVDQDDLLQPVSIEEQAGSTEEPEDVQIDMRVLIARLYDADGVLAELNRHLFWKAGTEEPIPEDVAPYVPIERVAPALVDFLIAHGRLLRTLSGTRLTGG